METSLKYWLLTTEYPPFFGGGISTYGRETVKMLQQSGYNITVFMPDRSVKEITSSTDDGVRIIRFDPFQLEERDYLGYETLVSLAFARVLGRFIEAEGQPWWIESQEYNGIAYFTLLQKHLLYPGFEGLRILVTVHAPSFVCLPYNHVATYRIPYFWIGEMEKFCLKAADLVIAPSHYMAEQINISAPEVSLRYQHLPNPFYLDDRYTAKSKNPVHRKEFVFYGKASPLKGIFELLRDFVPIWQQDPSIRLRLVGGLDYYYHPQQRLMGDIIKSKYKTQIDNGQLLIEGSISPGELHLRIHAAHAIIIPSNVDNLPYAVIECMALGKTVLASMSGGHRELIEDGISGFLFDHNRTGDLHEKLQHIIGLSDEALILTGVNARQRVADYCDPTAILARKTALLSAHKPDTSQPPSFPFLRTQTAQPSQPTQAAQLSQAYQPDHSPSEPGLLSVVIPYYNMGAYVDETIESIKRSAYHQTEIIIVDDGSTEQDSIGRLTKCEQDPSIRIIRKPNEGLSLARNTGAMAARGEFIAFLDPDDTIATDYYPKSIKLLRHYPNIYFAGAWVRYFGDAKGVWPCFTPEPPFVLFHNMINTSALVYKRSCFCQYGLNDKAMIFGMEDYDSLLNILSSGCNGIALPEPLFNYRVREGSMARQFTPGKILYLYQILANKHKKFYSSFAAELSNLLNSNGQGYLFDNPSLDLHMAAQSRVLRKLIGSRGIEFIRNNRRLKKTLILIQQLIKR